MELQPTAFDLPTAIDGAMLPMRERASRRGIILDRQVETGVGEILAEDVRAGIADGYGEIAVTDTGIGIAAEDQGSVLGPAR